MAERRLGHAGLIRCSRQLALLVNRDEIAKLARIHGASVLEWRIHYSSYYIFQIARGSLVWSWRARWKSTGEGDDRDGIAASRRKGRRNDPYGDGPDLRHDPGAAWRRGHQGRAAGGRQDPQPRRHGHLVLPAVQPRQAQRRARFCQG